jgi:hypothetical protein
LKLHSQVFHGFYNELLSYGSYPIESLWRFARKAVFRNPHEEKLFVTLRCFPKGRVVVYPQIVPKPNQSYRWLLVIHALLSLLFLRHRSLQYFTESQSRAHFFRHAKGRLQTGHVFLGRCGLMCITIMNDYCEKLF